MIIFIGRSTLEDGMATLYRNVGHHSPSEATQYRRRMEVLIARLRMFEKKNESAQITDGRNDQTM